MGERDIIRIGDLKFSDEEKKAIMDVCESNRITEHKKTLEFEEKWAEKIGTKYSTAVSSGTAGLILGLSALKCLANDCKRKKVITTPLTFVATSNAIRIAGLEPVFADIDKETFGILPSEIIKILENTDPSEFLAILPVHLMGYPCDMEEINKIAKEYNLFVFEDAAQAHGTIYKGKNLGSFGDLSNFSFYIMHNVQVGEFGAVNTDNIEIRNLLRRLKAHGRVCSCDICRRMEGKCPEIRKHTGDEDYDPRYTHELIGFNFKTNEFMSTLAIERLKKLEESNRKRRENVKYLNEKLEKYSDSLQLPKYNEDISYLGYPIILKKGSRKIMREELEKRGIETRILFGSIPHHQPSFAYLKKEYEGKLSNAEYTGRKGFFISCHQGLTKEELDRMVRTFEEIIDSGIYIKNKNLKIALIQPDSPYLSTPLSFPGLGLLYVSAYLKRNGYFPRIYDLTGGINLPENLNADIFGFSCQITQFKEVVDMAKKLREKNPSALFVIGGPFPTHSPQECLDSGFDIVVRGEGENPMLRILEDYPYIKDKIYTPTEHIDPNFFPDWGAINPLRYRYQLEGKRCINIMTKRGNCPYQCTFCSKQEVGKSPLRFRTVENVLEEIKFLKEKYGFGSVAIYDDDVLIDKERDKKIFEGLAKLGVPYRCMTRTNLASKEDLKMLKDTGCAEVCVGVETGDSHMLEKVIRKGVTVEQTTAFVKTCKELGLRVKTYLMIGLPGESKETVEKTREWLREVKPDNFDVNLFTPYPGCDIYEHKEKYQIGWDEKYLREIWFSGEAQYGRCAVFTPYLSSKQILNLKKEIETEFKRGEGGSTDYWGPIKQMKFKYFLNEPYIKGKEKEYISDVLDSGWLSIGGKHTKIFEKEFANMVGVKYALAVQSGTAALHTALLAVGIGKGDKVIVPNFTCGADITPIIQCGAIPVILDIEKDTFGLDADILEEFLRREKPKAVILVHLYGFPARDMDRIVEICKREKIYLIEDAAEAHGAEYKGKKLGSFGDISIFSVRSEKMIGVGEGGLVLTDNKELSEKAYYWAGRAAPCRGDEYPYWYKYYYTGVGMNYLMPHLLGAVGHAQIENFENILVHKREVGEKYQSIARNIPGIKMQKKINSANPCYWLNTIILEDFPTEKVREIGKKLIEEGIEARSPFWPLGDQEIFREFVYGTQENGNFIFEKGIVLPSSIHLSENNCKPVEEIMEIFLRIKNEVIGNNSAV